MSSSSSSSSSTATADSTTNGQNDTKTSGSKAVIDFSLTAEYNWILSIGRRKEGWVLRLRNSLVETGFEAATQPAGAVFSESTSSFQKDCEDADEAAKKVLEDVALKAKATYDAALEKAEKADSDRKEGQPGLLEAKKIATETYEKTLEVARNDFNTATNAAEIAYLEAVKPAQKTYDDATAPAATVRETIKGEEDPVFSDTLNGALKVFEAARRTAEAASIAGVESAKQPDPDWGVCYRFRVQAAQTAFDKSCKAACDPVFKRFRERFEAAMATSVDTSH